MVTKLNFQANMAIWTNFLLHAACCKLTYIKKAHHISVISEADQKSYQTVNEEKLEDVQQHPPQWDLQGPEVGVGGEEGNESEGAEDVGDGEQSLGYQRRVPHLPLLPRTRGVILEEEEI